MKSIALTTALSLAMAGSTFAVPMMQTSQGHAVAHINAEALKNNLEMAKANTMASQETNTNMKRQTTPGSAPITSAPVGAIPSVTLTDLDRVVSSVGVIVKNAQDDLKKIDIKDPQGVVGILSQLLGNVTQTVQQGNARIKANQKAILPTGWGVAGSALPLGALGGLTGGLPLGALGGLGGLGGLTGGLGGLGALSGVTNGLAGLTGVTGLLSSLLNTVTGLLGNLLQLGDGLPGLGGLGGGLTGGATGGLPLGALPLGDLSNLTGVLSPDLLNQLLGGATGAVGGATGGAGSPLSVVSALLAAVMDLVNSLLPGALGVTAGITGGLTATA
ncbi:hypothetical protein N0V85_008285 [Neurospora sp. IMI 360204]|nr:hypothetical protein N0V85_008285 [Neurospora sp. IMI 360204]